jgi:hypothetical protein
MNFSYSFIFTVKKLHSQFNPRRFHGLILHDLPFIPPDQVIVIFYYLIKANFLQLFMIMFSKHHKSEFTTDLQ